MEELVTGAKNVHVDLTPTQEASFAIMLKELKAWNEHTNLTGITIDIDIIRKHFIDSLSVIQAIPKDAQTLIDIGTGAGFPGLPIAIIRPDLKITLVESTGKKVQYLNYIIAKLGLTNVTTINARAEEIAHTPEYREQFDVATSRAVAELRVLLEYAIPLLKTKGTLIAQKNTGNEEISNAVNALNALDSSLTTQIPIHIKDLPERQLIVITKDKPTGKEFPRRSGIPAQKPL